MILYMIEADDGDGHVIHPEEGAFHTHGDARIARETFLLKWCHYRPRDVRIGKYGITRIDLGARKAKRGAKR